MSNRTDTPKAKSKVLTVTLPAPVAERIERVRARHAVGSAAPPFAALVVSAVEHGLDQLETASESAA
jgi:hypothetical protein